MTGTVVASAPRGAAEAAPRLVVLAAVYLVLLVWVVLWKLEVPWVGVAGERIVKLVPFVATGTAGASRPFEVVVNVALFVPLGLYLGLLAPGWRWWRVAGAAAAVSVGLEVTQYVLAVGSTDLTDVVANTVGALAGLGLLVRGRRRYGASTVTALTRVCTTGTVLAVLACGLVVASPLRYAAPEDVRCDRVSGHCGPPLRVSPTAAAASSTRRGLAACRGGSTQARPGTSAASRRRGLEGRSAPARPARREIGERR